MSFFDLFKRKKNEQPIEELQWNKMWDLWTEEKADSPYAEFMTYQSEINNGGHDQYFLNFENTSDLEKMSVLEQILSAKLKDNLRKAYQAYLTLEKMKTTKMLKKYQKNMLEMNQLKKIIELMMMIY